MQISAQAKTPLFQVSELGHSSTTDHKQLFLPDISETSTVGIIVSSDFWFLKRLIDIGLLFVKRLEDKK